MSMHRREFIQSGTAASFLAALGWPALAADAPTVGLIFPPANYPIPPDAGRLYPSGVRFIGNGLGFNGMTIESYNEAIPRAMPRAQELAAQGANLISVFGSSITFYKGAAFNQELDGQGHRADGPAGDDAEQRPRRRLEARQREARRRRDGVHGHRHGAARGLS